MAIQFLEKNLTIELIGDNERGYDFIDPEDIRGLRQLAEEPEVFSLYLDLTAERMQRAPLSLRYKKLVEEARQRLESQVTNDDNLRETRLLFEAVAEDIGKLLERSYNRPRGRGLALFAIPERVSFKGGRAVKYKRLARYHLPEPPRDLLEWGEGPALTPLLVQMNEHAPIGVVLVDKRRARFFLYYMGEAAEYGFSEVGETPPHTRAVGWGAHNHEQWLEEHYHKHLQQVAELTAKLAKEGGWSRLIIGGVGQAPADLRSRLPKQLQSQTLGLFNAELTASYNQVRDAVAPLATQAEAGEEAAILDAWMGALETPGGRAVAGLADVTMAAQQGRIETLIIPPDKVQPGWQCQSCQGLMADILAEPPTECIYCGGPLRAIPDIIGVVATQTLNLGGQVEVVREADNLAMLEGHGEIGALLRF